MKGIKQYIFIIILFALSCNSPNKQLSPSEYIDWVNSNDLLNKSHKTTFYTYSSSLIPYEYNIAIALAENNLQQSPETLKDEYSNFITFKFVVNCNDSTQNPLLFNTSSNEEYSMRLQYCSFEIFQDFELIIGKDTLDCVDARIIQEYSMKPYCTIIVNFESDYLISENPTSDICLVYYDNLWGNGIFKFRYTIEQLKQVPTLKY